jgi:hydroxyethylthiazole kinase-like uncharacterized protein yjeF
LHELLTPGQMANADLLTISQGTPGIDLMERAGRAVADAVVRRLPLGERVAVACGPGNNGGDGFVAARILTERGYRVRLGLLGDRERLTGDAALAAGRWKGAVEPLSPDLLAGSGLVVDALFGSGLARPLDGAAAVFVTATNASGLPVVAVDLPSGIDGLTGQVLGVGVEASETITFFRRKPGHVLMPGRTFCGRTRVAGIGIADEVLDDVQPHIFVNDPALWGDSFPWPRIGGHKYDRGHAVVMSGPVETTGAARLAARSALRSGAGLVTIASPRNALQVHAATNLAVMVRPVDGAAAIARFLEDRRLNAVLIGPGGGIGPEMRATVQAVLAAHRRTVLDADALTSFAGEADAVFAPPPGGLPETVITPHDGEFGRLFSTQPDITGAPSRLQRARMAAAAFGIVVVLKGPDTVVASPDGRATIAENAPPFLATAGSGDVLAGIVTGLLAQGMPAFDAASAAVWLHGELGREVGPGLIAEDLDAALRPVLRRLMEQTGNAPSS